MRWWIAAALGIGFLFFFRLTDMGLVGPDEPRYAAVSRAMAVSGDWVTPRLWGEPWFEKPALLYWMTAAAFRAGLDADWAPRLPVALLSAGFLLFFYRRLKDEFGAVAAGYAAAILATSAGWVAYSHAAVFDLPLAATLGASMLWLLGWVERADRRSLVIAAALAGASMLAKGLVGPALAALTLLVCAARYGPAVLGDLFRPAPVLAFGLVAAPWYLWCLAHNGMPFLEEFFWKHHFTRFAAGALEHHQPVWYFLPVLALGLLPWTPLYALAGAARPWRDRRGFFLLAWAGVTVVFFSVSRDKLPGYVLPALPALAALSGLTLARRTQPLRWTLPLCAATLALFPTAAAVLPEALNSGLGQAIDQAQVGPPALALVAALAGAVAWAEHCGRRPLSVACLALAAVAGYAWMKQTTFPLIDRQAGARPLWRQAAPHRDAVCLGEVRRHLAYGLYYYAGRRLPDCSQDPQPFRIEGDRVLSSQ